MTDEILLFDGAMGTLLQPSSRPEEVSVTNPERVQAIHEAYIEAGAKAIKTNTFGLTDDCPEDVLQASIKAAKKAVQDKDVLIFGDIGPKGAKTESGVYRKMALALQRLGLSHFLFETLPDCQGIEEAAKALKEKDPNCFVLVSFAAGPDGITASGHPVRDFLLEMDACDDVDAVGLNCMCGPHHMAALMEQLPVFSKPLSIMPNAGYPSVLGRKTVYHGSPDYFAQKMGQMVSRGAQIVGGCCGTTPAHIHALKQVLQERIPAEETKERTERKNHTNSANDAFGRKLDNHEFVIAVELDPPAHDRVGGFLEGAGRLVQAGADVITIADCPVGRPRADSSLLACKVKRELGADVLPHMTCRDRNLNAAKALLMGLSMEDVHNVLLVTGDPLPSSLRDEVKSVFSFHSRQLARYVSQLNETVLSVPFRMFGALNLNAVNFDMQLKIAKEKEEAGISGFLTQPVLSQKAYENLKIARKALNGKILCGIFPVVSWKNAMFLNNEVNGVDVCDEIAQLYEGLDRQEGEEMAVKISLAISEKVRPYCDGLYFMTPFNRIQLMERILAGVKSTSNNQT